MNKSVLEQYNVSDFIEWSKKKQLILNPEFQRRNVWTLDGKSYLIQTLLRGLPMPKVYIRTVINVATQKSIRDVVDGQQRMRAILDFASGDLRLNKRAEEYEGCHYEDLDEELQENFLTYAISVEQLINATDEDVLEVFARLNSYAVQLSPAELRHAKYQGDFKWTVRKTATELGDFWKRYNILSTRQRVRMQDDELTAELFGAILGGVRDGGQPSIKKLYDEYDEHLPRADRITSRVLRTIKYIRQNFEEALAGEVLSRPPQFLMFFAVIAHALEGIPAGDLGKDLPRRGRKIRLDTARTNLALMTNAVLEKSTSKRFKAFVQASSSTTQRIASRKVRFLFLWRALTEPL
jgi:hypothetical protein